jgi:ribosomal protein S8
MVNVPKDFQDYDDDDENLEKRKSRMKYRQNLKNLKLEFINETGSRDHREYTKWLENKYGFQPVETNQGMMTDDYKVVDEKKFIVYILKYGK